MPQPERPEVPVPEGFEVPVPDIRRAVLPRGPLHRTVLGGAATRSDAVALVEGDGRAAGYGQLAHVVEVLAAELAGEHAVAPGDRVAILMPNAIETVCAHLALSRAGAAAVPINPSYRTAEIARVLRAAGADTLLTTRELAGAAPAEVSGRRIRVVPLAGPLSFEALAGRPPAVAGPEPDGADLAWLPFSSGTTGTPKGVMLSHDNLAATIEQFARAIDMTADDRPVNFLPMSHIYGFMLTAAALRRGARAILLDRFELNRTLALVQSARATMLFAVPPVIDALAREDAVLRYDLSSLRFINTGAAPLAPARIERAAARAGCPVITGYGLTEAAPVSHSELDRNATAPGYVGRLVSWTEARLIDPERPATFLDGEGAVGELVVRGPQVTRGYLDDETATAAHRVEGWWRTGDIARLGPEGTVTLVGRRKEIIKFKGFSVAPAELEAVLAEHPAVLDAAVVGRPDAEAGEVPVGYVVVRDGGTDTEEVLTFAAERLAGYKRLHALHVVERIPRSTAGKILRGELGR